MNRPGATWTDWVRYNGCPVPQHRFVDMKPGLFIRHNVLFLCVCSLFACSGEQPPGEITTPEYTTHGTTVGVANDTVDFDGNNDPVLTELQVDGELRKVLIQANRNGFFYVLDRTDGEFIDAHPFVEMNNGLFPPSSTAKAICRPGEIS